MRALQGALTRPPPALLIVLAKQVDDMPDVYRALVDKNAALWRPVVDKLKRLNLQLRDSGALASYGTGSGAPRKS